MNPHGVVVTGSVKLKNALHGRWMAMKWLARFGAIFSSTLISAACSFLCQFLLARRLQPSEYGFIVVLLALSNFLQPFGNFGLPWLVVQESAREQNDGSRWARAAFPALLSSAILTSVVSLLYIRFAAPPGGVSVLIVMFLFLPLLFCQPWVEMAAARSQIRGRFTAMSVWQISIQGLRLAATAGLFFGFVLNYRNAVVAYSVAAVIPSVAAFLSVYAWAYKRKDDARTKLSTWFVMKLAAPYCVMTLTSVGASQLSVLIVNVLGSKVNAAEFGLASLIVSATYLIPGVLYSKLLLPPIAKWSVSDRPRFIALYQVGVAGMTAIGVAGMVVLILGAPLIANVIFAKKYDGIIPVIYIFAAAIPFRFAGSAIGSVLFLRESVVKKAVFNGVAGAIVVASSFLLVRPFGASGAAIGAVAGEVALALLQLWAVEKIAPEVNTLAAFNGAALAKHFRLLQASH